MLSPALYLLTLVLSACTVAPVEPSITTFADTTTQAVKVGEDSLKKEKLDEKVSAVLRQEMAAAKAVYGLDIKVTSRCRPATPLFADPSREFSAFSVRCPINAYRLTTDGLEELFIPNLPTYGKEDTSRQPTPDELVTAQYQAWRSMNALENYATALAAVSASTGPTDVASATSDAVVAIGNAASTVASFAGTPIPKSFKPVISTGGSLIAQLVGESLEAKRYALLASIVRSADHSVTELSRRVSIWFFLTERNKLYRRYDAFDKALNDSAPGVAADLLSVEKAYEAARSADKAAKWRVFWNIAVAHHAILASLEEPSDFNRLLTANERIQKLAELTKYFVESVKKSRE